MGRDVLCNAFPTTVRERQTGVNDYFVEVWGRPPHDFRRTYEISAKSATLAAQDGIRRFVEEMEARDTPAG